MAATLTRRSKSSDAGGRYGVRPHFELLFADATVTLDSIPFDFRKLGDSSRGERFK